MTTPDPDLALTFRLEELLGGHDVHPADRQRIQQAYLAAGGADARFDDLPDDIRALIVTLEGSLPAQSWDDPADVPDEVLDGT